MTVRDYSTTANDNTTINGITLADTMLANALDNAIRQAMADTGNFLLDIAKPTSTTGSANAYLLTTGGTVGAYVDKVRLAIRPNFSNTGACTINVDTVGVVDLKIYTSSGVGDPTSGAIQSGGVYDILYVDALGDFVVLNPTPLADAGGDMVGANNLSDVANASTSFDNIKQLASTSKTGVVEKATVIEAEEGTEADKYPDVVRTKQAIDAQVPILFSASGSAPMFACRAWVNFNGTGTVTINESGNVSSITDNGVGKYAVNYITDMEDANYCVVSSGATATSYTTNPGPVEATVGAYILSTSSCDVASTRPADGGDIAVPKDLELGYVTIFR